MSLVTHLHTIIILLLLFFVLILCLEIKFINVYLQGCKSCVNGSKVETEVVLLN